MLTALSLQCTLVFITHFSLLFEAITSSYKLWNDMLFFSTGKQIFAFQGRDGNNVAYKHIV